jgi:pheromone shutdown protein TraB
MSNPYESPQFVSAIVVAEPSDREKLRRVARYQQWVLYALLSQILIYASIVFLQGAGFPGMAQLMAIVFLPVGLFSMAAVFLLAKQLLHVVIAVICTLLMVVPCISLLVLLVVNGRATKFLQQHGVKVGFMGANPHTI